MDGMVISFHIKPDRVDEFVEACLDNARHTLAVEGTIRFEVVQDAKDPTKVVLIECYASDEVKRAHLASDHFKRWREATKDLHASSPDFVGGRYLIGRGVEEPSS